MSETQSAAVAAAVDAGTGTAAAGDTPGETMATATAEPGACYVVLGAAEHDLGRLCADPESTRYAMNGVAIDGEAGFAVATDGTKLLCVPLDRVPVAETPDGICAAAGPPTNGELAVIPTDAIGAALKAIPRARRGTYLPRRIKLGVYMGVARAAVPPVDPRLGAPGIASVPMRVAMAVPTGVDTTACLPTDTIEGRFPPYRDVIPSRADAHVTIAFDPALLGQLCEWAAKHCGPESRGIRMFLPRPDAHGRMTGGVRVEIAMADGRGVAIGCIMSLSVQSEHTPDTLPDVPF